ncbi:hypothetical protein F7Q92_21445, partial [Ideonella dechloratans]
MSAIAWNAVRDGNGITVRHQWNAQSFLTGPCVTDGSPLAEHPFWRFWSDYRIDPALLARFLAAWPT